MEGREEVDESVGTPDDAHEFRPGDRVPRDGVVKCTQTYNRLARVEEGDEFGRCDAWGGRMHGLQCTWRYTENSGIAIPRVEGYWPQRVSGRVELRAGWQLTLANPCMEERHADGSWLAWDRSHTIAVQIEAKGRTRRGAATDARTMLGREPDTGGSGWIGYVDGSSEVSDDGDHRVTLTAAAPNTMMTCSVSYPDAEDRSWSDNLFRSISFVPPVASHHLFGH